MNALQLKSLALRFGIAAFISCAVPGLIKAQQATNFKDEINIVYQNIYRHFYDSSKQLFIEKTVLKADEKPYAYLWPVCALVQAANEMEVLEPAKKILPPVVAIIDKYYNPAKAPHPGYDSYVVSEGGGDRFYDDNQWIGIAYLDAYTRNKDAAYLRLGKDIYDYMLTGYDTVSGGGLYWKEFDKTTKNTCSNGPAVIMALQLYDITKQKRYMDTAMLLYDWTNKNLQAADKLFYDNIRLQARTIDQRKYTYNSGTMLQSNVMLYGITKDKKYLQRAQDLAAASLAHFYKNNLYPDNYWFNAVLLRGYIDLYKVDGEKKYVQSFNTYAKEVWKTQRDNKNLIGTRKVKSLIDQAGYLEIIARLAQVPGLI
ncbi:MAG: glycoside hydrolase family 76 protein [Bacteroidota bacterium]